MKKYHKPLQSVLVKPAGPDCNMACTYCFYLEKSDLFRETRVHRMSEEILEELVRQMMTQTQSNVSFGWQGGEPTLMGLPFFEKAVEFQQNYGRNQMVGNGLQTNGILIDKDWAKFLAEYKFLVGLSLDGPEHIHNRYRIMPSGKGSWNKVVDSGKRMLDAGVEVNALTVVNDYSAQFPEEIYEFHRETGLNFMQFIPCLEPDAVDHRKPAPFSANPEAYGKFLCRIFDLWKQDFVDDVPTTSVRLFDSLFYTYVNMTAPECTLLPECGVYVVVEHNGDVYSCDFFVDPEWKLGNVQSDILVDLLNSPQQSEFGKIKSKLPEMCRNCKWLKRCWGGCPKDRFVSGSVENLNYFCQSYQMLFEHADDYFKQLANNWINKQQNEIVQKRQEIQNAVRDGKISVGRNDPCPCGSGKKFKKCCGQDL